MKISSRRGMPTRQLTGLFLAVTFVLAGVPAMGAEACRQIRGAATPDDVSDDVSVCRQDVWFHAGGTRLGNLAGAGAGPVASWNTTKPTGNLATGGAAHVTLAAYDIVFTGDPAGRPTFAGSFTGPIDSLAFSAFLRAPTYEAGDGNWPAVAYLEIDGVTIHDNFPGDAIDLPMKTEGQLRRIDGVFTGVYDMLQTEGLDLSPGATHTVKVGLVPWYFGESHSVLFYDAAEAASGLIFNPGPEALSGYTPIPVS